MFALVCVVWGASWRWRGRLWRGNSEGIAYRFCDGSLLVAMAVGAKCFESKDCGARTAGGGQQLTRHLEVWERAYAAGQADVQASVITFCLFNRH